MPKKTVPKGRSAVHLLPWAVALVRAEIASRRAKSQRTGLRIGVLCCAAVVGLSALIAYAPMTLVQLLAPCLCVLVVAIVVPPESLRRSRQGTPIR